MENSNVSSQSIHTKEQKMQKLALFVLAVEQISNHLIDQYSEDKYLTHHLESLVQLANENKNIF